jgi:hypothetical protein
LHRAWLSRLLALTVASTGCGGVVELIFRIREHNETRAEASATWVADRTYGARYTRGWPSVDGNTFTNARPLERKSRLKRIAFIGDSYVQTTAGGRETVRKSMVVAVEDHLNQSIGGGFETINFGQSSTGPVHYWIRYRRVVTQYDHDVVVVCLHDNDPIDSSDINPNEMMRPIYTFDKNGGIDAVRFAYDPLAEAARTLLRHSAIYRSVRFRSLIGTGTTPQVESSVGPVPLDLDVHPFIDLFSTQNTYTKMRALPQFFYWIDKIHEAVTNDGKSVLFVYAPGRQASVARDEARWRQWANAHGFDVDFGQLESALRDHMRTKGYEFYSLRGDFSSQEAPQRLFYPEKSPEGDGFGHWNDAGNQLAGDRIAEWILKLIDEGKLADLRR